jgi:phosphatidylglycerophosphatase C
MEKVAVFDFDGTLTDRDMFFGFLLYVKGAFKTYLKLFFLTPFFILYLFKVISREKMKEKVISAVLAGTKESTLTFLGKKYAQEVVPLCIQRKIFEKLKEHQKKGERVIIVSASIPYYLIPWAESQGIREVFCTHIEVIQGKVTGKLQGNNCWGPEKARLLTQILSPREHFEIFAYGNSRGDQEMLKMADHSLMC